MRVSLGISIVVAAANVVGAQTVGGTLGCGPGSASCTSVAYTPSGLSQYRDPLRDPSTKASNPTSDLLPELVPETCSIRPQDSRAPQTATCLLDSKGHLRVALFPANAAHPRGLLEAFGVDAQTHRNQVRAVVPLGAPRAIDRTLESAGLDAETRRAALAYLGTVERARVASLAPKAVLASYAGRAPGSGASASRLTPSSGASIGSGSASYQYDENDRLTSINGSSVEHDANGNMTRGADGSTYTYDFENHLTRATRPDGSVIDHVYDADGIRVQTTTTVPGQAPRVVNYLVDPTESVPQVVAETDGAGNVQAFYNRGVDGELLSIMRPAGGGFQTRFVHADGLGSVRRLTDEAGNITDGYTYAASGELLAHTGPDSQPFAFAGEAFDLNTGLSYNRARWFDPSLGRFLSMDPYGGNTHDPVSLHRYLYAGDDPVNRIDPTGEDFTLAENFAGFSMMETTFAIAPPPSLRAALSGRSKQVQITIDDGPLATDAGMRSLLKQFGIKTMFFVVGQEVAARPGDLRAILDDGHSLGNHSWAHEYLPGLSAAGVRHSLFRTDQAVRKIAGYDMTPNWRAPFGARNGTVETAAASLGYTQHWGWTIDSEDSGKLQGKTTEMLAHLRHELERCVAPRCQILFHDFPTSLASLTTILPALKDEGYKFVPFP